MMFAEVTIIGLVLVLVGLAVLAGLIHAFGKNLSPKILTVIDIVIILTAVLFALEAFGILDIIKSTKVPRFYSATGRLGGTE